MVRDVLAIALEVDDNLDQLMVNHTFWKAVRILSWVARFLHNCRNKPKQRLSGPLKTEEIDEQIGVWVKRAQATYLKTEQFEEDKLRLNLQKNSREVYECRGRIQGDYLIYLPPNSIFSEKMVMAAHRRTLHGGVGLTMAAIRSRYWIPRLRQLVKRMIKRCYECKRFQAVAHAHPPVGNLPKDRTEGSVPFQVIGVDFAGPIAYQTKGNKDGKAYIILFTCSLTRTVYLELLPNQTTEEFIRSLKRLIARRGEPEKIYSDNGKTFVAAARWLCKIMKEEVFNDFLAKHSIRWQFNLSRAPWWGGQFERMVGLVKQAFYKTVGGAKLKWDELQNVLLDCEITLNNRPLSYLEDDIQLPILTPNIMMFGQPNLLPEEPVELITEKDMRKRARYLKRCKDVLWS